MNAQPKQVAVLGSGSWGTALAAHLCRQGHQTIIWGKDSSVIAEINNGTNSRFFPNQKLPLEIKAEGSLEKTLLSAEVVVMAVPAAAMRSVAKQARDFLLKNAIIVSTAKGLERESSKRMSSVLAEELGADARVAVLSGPSFALEVLQGKYTALTMAASSLSLADEARAVFHSAQFRVYASADVVGVEFGGVFKNVIAIASGMVDGMELGDNARAALVTRGLAELQRFVVAQGGERLTAIGLSGLGDLMLTATGNLSRNREVGLRIGRGEKLTDVVAGIHQVAEGVYSSEVVLKMATEKRLELPIVHAVTKILRGEISAKSAVEQLFSRPAATEN